MRRSIGLLAMAVVLSLGVSAKADILSFDFLNAGAGDQGITHNFVSETPVNPAYYIVATANSQGNLFVKTAGGDESGLGLTKDFNTGQNEIAAGTITLDFTHLKSVINITGITFQIGSAQINEGYKITGNSSGQYTYTPVSGDPTQFTVPISSVDLANNTFTFAAVGTGNSGHPNILINTLTVTGVPVVPEPSTLAIAGLGALGFGANLWRRRRGR